MSSRRELGEALTILAAHPVPIVTWKVYAELGSLETALGDAGAAREAFQAGYRIVQAIAEGVEDLSVRRAFWNSAEVRAVSAGVGIVAGGRRPAPALSILQARFRAQPATANAPVKVLSQNPFFVVVSPDEFTRVNVRASEAAAAARITQASDHSAQRQ